MKKSKSPNLNPCALAGTLGLFTGLDLMLHAFSDVYNTSFLWFTQASNQIFLTKVPGYTSSLICIPWALLVGLLIGGVLGFAFAMVYNYINSECGTPFCKK